MSSTNILSIKRAFEGFQIVGSLLFLLLAPKCVWAEAHQHFRSLTEVLPFVLFGHMIRHLKESKSNYSPIQDDSASIDRVSFETLRVLVFEDNVVNQKVLSRILSRLGVRNCTVGKNGAEAVEREQNEPFAGVLMDMQMPVMNGTEATRRIFSRSEEGSHPRAPVSPRYRSCCGSLGGPVSKLRCSRLSFQALQHGKGGGVFAALCLGQIWCHMISTILICPHFLHSSQ